MWTPDGIEISGMSAELQQALQSKAALAATVSDFKRLVGDAGSNTMEEDGEEQEQLRSAAESAANENVHVE